MVKRSRIQRLARRDEKLVIKRIVYLSVISVILAVFLFTLGIPLLGKFSDIVNSIFGKNQTETSIQNTLRAPRLDTLPTATNSAKLSVPGFSEEDTKIDIYLNDEKIGTAGVTGGKFVFDDLSLSDGQNKVFAKAVATSGSESEPSESQNVVLDTKEPTLEVESPTDDQSFSANNRIKVFGKTDKDAQVFANGFLASIDSENNFEVFVPLVEGENKLEIKAVGEAGNSKTRSLKVNFGK